jgi:hypothetical protein
MLISFVTAYMFYVRRLICRRLAANQSHLYQFLLNRGTLTKSTAAFRAACAGDWPLPVVAAMKHRRDGGITVWPLASCRFPSPHRWADAVRLLVRLYGGGHRGPADLGHSTGGPTNGATQLSSPRLFPLIGAAILRRCSCRGVWLRRLAW